MSSVSKKVESIQSITPNSRLKVKDLSVGYGFNAVASQIDFELHTGDLAAIIGINGIGKSTLLRTLGNMQPPISGEIRIKERLLPSFKPKQLATTVSLVLTEAIATKNLTVAELVALGRQPYTNWIGTLSKQDKEQVTNALHLLDLEQLQEKKCYELSDGQLQRVLIARALAQDTSIILLDEPTTHLDLYHKVKILKLLKTIAKKTKKTILFTSHEIEMCLQLCDTLLLLTGNNNPFGTPSKLIEQGVFGKLFPSDTVSFDTKSASFRIKK